MPWPQTPQDRISLLTKRNSDLDALAHLPGVRRCPKCRFETTFTAAGPDGPVPIEMGPHTSCPKCRVPMWRVGERQKRQELEAEVERLLDRLDGLDEIRAQQLILSAFLIGVTAAGAGAEEIARRRAEVERWEVRLPTGVAGGDAA